MSVNIWQTSTKISSSPCVHTVYDCNTINMSQTTKESLQRYLGPLVLSITREVTARNMNIICCWIAGFIVQKDTDICLSLSSTRMSKNHEPSLCTCVCTHHFFMINCLARKHMFAFHPRVWQSGTNGVIPLTFTHGRYKEEEEICCTVGKYCCRLWARKPGWEVCELRVVISEPGEAWASAAL